MSKIKQLLAGIILLAMHNMSAQDIAGPAGSGAFGSVTVLPNGNFVVVDTGYDEGATLNVGAVYLYNGATKALISTLKGSTAEDAIGSQFITVLTNGNYVIRSNNWDNGGVVNAGAVTWGSATTGVSGVVSSSNSLVGSTATDQVGNGGIITLTNGNYVVTSTGWDNGGTVDVGAVTWGNGTTGTAGVVSSSNSLVGSRASDTVGTGVSALTNGNYVVRSQNWDNGAINFAGAVTWGNGTTGISGVISSSNSLVGSTAGDSVGTSVIALNNGNYVVRNINWNNGAINAAGAVTWGNGTTGVSGEVSSSNSLVGSTATDQVGSSGVTALTNGNYVVTSNNWDNGATVNAGAVTWGNGTTGTSGVVSSSNSLVGSITSDQIGTTVTALTNGNYVVTSTNWDNGANADVGAATWCDGTTGITGTISSSNSLVGSTASDLVGTAVTALTNGNYVVTSTSWDNGGTVNVGAATWGDGTTGTTGFVSSSNSLVGSTASDQAGTSVIALTNGNYVVRNINWDNGAINAAGAVTWGNGSTGITGNISSSNSLVGSTANDQIGAAVTALTNGNYVIRSIGWSNGAMGNAGAVTWGNGTTGVSGEVSSSNSLIGSTANEQVGTSVIALTNGNYVIRSIAWDNGGVDAAGAVTWGNGSTGITGNISSSNSLVGSTALDQVGTSVTALTNGNYIVRSNNWDNGAIVNARAATLGNGATGTSGVITACNSVLGEAASDVTINVFNYVYDYMITGKTVSNKVNISNTIITTPSVSIVSSDVDNSIASGTSVTFTATPIKGGTTPSYQWKVNGTNAGTDSATFTTTALTHNDSVTVVLTSNDPCVSPTTATSNAIVTAVTSNTTQIQAVFDGTTLTSITELIYVDEVPGAEAYFYELTPTSGAVITKERAANEFAEDEFHFVHTNYAQYNMAYTVKVKVRMGGVLGDFGPAVVITTPAAPTTKLQTAFCDVTIPALTTKLYADGVTSATGYRFEIVNGGTTRIYDTSLSFVDLTKVPGSAAYATTYTIRVAPLLNGVYTTYGTACNVTTPAPPAEVVTQLSASHTNLTVLNQKITAIAITGATSYRFEVTNQTTSHVQVYDTNTISSSFNLSQLATKPTYATTYSIKVAYKTTGAYGSYGAARTVTTPALPTTKIRTLNCGTTLATLSSMIACNGIVGATNYTFEIIRNGGTAIEYETSLISFKLRDVAGLAVTTNSTYVIRVKAKVGGVYGAYGEACNVMTGASREGDIEEKTTSDFTVASFPNPFVNTFQLDLRSTSNNEVNVMVYDMIGKQIENRSFNALEVYNQTFGTNYAAGVYNVMVSQNETTKTVRVIKN